MEELAKYSVRKSKVGDWDIDFEYDPKTNKTLIKAKKMDGKKVEDSWEQEVPDGISDDQLSEFVAAKCLGVPVGTEIECPSCGGMMIGVDYAKPGGDVTVTKEMVEALE